jgi:hypothetical protein
MKVNNKITVLAAMAMFLSKLLSSMVRASPFVGGTLVYGEHAWTCSAELVLTRCIGNHPSPMFDVFDDERDSRIKVKDPKNHIFYRKLVQ